MTEENCNTENWDADPDIYKPVSFFDKLVVAIKAFVRWFKVFIEYIAVNSDNMYFALQKIPFRDVEVDQTG